MNTINGFLDSVSSVLKSSTGTGLDVLETNSVPSRVATKLFHADRVPARSADVARAISEVTGRAASESDMLTAEHFLLSLGFLR
ncbi:hypothetical protein [Corynebacterium anserum]|uniref:Uncharacterized protein n=1 Tax=Corynebacterium anserum TaxID=2684406 RepID=A0A7G7YP11_9CORY|nr:hypothetical protein [Corynebacterium anserum]MBC2681832.1 hypothetical protein [Corynebacterium anserum]QNH96231.1 hypothetical protein GP473_05765 [Corynebacterium anserum]